ncbi:MAG: tetratricopeptide repeat protein, partial [Hyphomicrobium sp.]
MTQFQRLARGAALAVAAVCVFAGALGGWPSPGEARKSKSQPAAGAQAGAQPAGPQRGGQAGGDVDDKAQVAGRQAYDTGLKEFANGHLQPAVDQFTAALNSGGLLAPQMAKALYTRGLAYKKLNRPSLAIADLTSALWLKNGLSGDDKDKATAERAEAYQAAGIADTGNLPAVRKAVADTGATVNDSSAGLSAAAIAQAATP